MPTYDYECQACGHKFEVFQSITDKPIRKCPVCNKLKVKRLIGLGGGIIFRGSGFYATDYRNSKPSNSESKTPDSKKSEDKSDSSSSSSNSEKT